MAGERFAEVQGNDAVRGDWIKDAFRVLVSGGALYLFVCWDRLQEWRENMEAAGFKVRSCIVWDKAIHGLADLETCWGPQHEMILFGAKGRHELRGKRPTDVLRIPRVDASKLLHPYEKPVPLMKRLIEASTDPGDTVLDPFMGSGPTAVASIQMGRDFIGSEIDPAYFSVTECRIAEAQGVGTLFPERPLRSYTACPLFAGGEQ